jgi:modification methylase
MDERKPAEIGRMLETVHRFAAADAASCPWIPNGSVSLVVTSPPYPMIAMWDGVFAGRSRETRRALEAGDGFAAFELMHRDLDRVWAEAARALCPGGWACVNVGDAARSIGGVFRLYPNHARIIDAFLRLGFDTLPLILWRKQTNAPNKFMGSGMLPAGAYVTLEHEYILLFRKPGKRPFESADGKRLRRESACFWEERNRWFSDTWDFKGARQCMSAKAARPTGTRAASTSAAPRDRSAAFPFELPWRLINMYSLYGDTVWDPFVGTGTTIHAAMAAGRNGIGVDIEPTLAARARKDGMDLASPMAARVRDRLADHLAFVEDSAAAGRILRYKNKTHCFPVMTAQETDLTLLAAAEIRAEGRDGLRVRCEELTRE